MVGFWPALVIAPLLCGAIGAAIEVWGLRRVHHNGHIAELLFTFGLVFIIGRVRADGLGHAAVPYRVPALLDFPLFTLYGEHFPAYRGFMLLVSARHAGRDLAAAEAHAHRPDHPGGADPSAAW